MDEANENLETRDREIYRLIQKEGMYQSDVADKFGLSRQRVSQIYHRIREEKDKESMVKKVRFEERMPGFACTAEQAEKVERLINENYRYSNLMRDALDMFIEANLDSSDTEQGSE